MGRLMNMKPKQHPPRYDQQRMQTRTERKLSGVRIKKRPRCGHGKVLRRCQTPRGLNYYCIFCSKELDKGYYNCDCHEHEERRVCGRCIAARVKQEQKEQSARMNLIVRKSAWQRNRVAEEEKYIAERTRRKNQAKCCKGKLIFKKKVKAGSGKIKCYVCNDYDTGGAKDEEKVEIFLQEGEAYFDCDCARHANRTVCSVHLQKRMRQEKEEQREKMYRMMRHPDGGDYLLRTTGHRPRRATKRKTKRRVASTI